MCLKIDTPKRHGVPSGSVFGIVPSRSVHTGKRHPKETCTKEISQRDLQVPLENVFIVTQRDLHIRNFPKRLKVPSENVFVITKEHSLMGLLFGKLSLFR